MNSQPTDYSPDSPITTRSEDRFGRHPFARRIAETIRARTDPSGLVIGIYGPWGDGKTSVLNLIEEEVRADPQIVSVRFNPWLFDSEAALTVGFFTTLTDALGKKLSSRKKEIGQVLEHIGSALSIISFATTAGTVDPGPSVGKLGEKLSNVSLDENRAKFEKILLETGKTVIVFADDLDRLDRDDLHAMLRLVKLSGGFDHVVYILACDEEIVAEAIGRRYGEQGALSGRKFMEKIVQVPLTLPPADPTVLRQIVYEGLTGILNREGIELTEEEKWRFTGHFESAFQPALETPRQAKRYLNATEFAVPILGGEVDPVDQMLIEGLRAFYPVLYKAIRSDPATFIGAIRLYMNRDEWRKQSRNKVQELLKTTAARDVEPLQRLLWDLFPELERGMASMEIETATRARRVCCHDYFPRYFHYGLPPFDISDQRARGLVEQSGTNLTSEIRELAVNPRSAELLIDKLQSLSDELLAARARELAGALVQNAELFPESGGFLGLRTLQARACNLLVRLVECAQSRQRRAIVRSVASSAEPPFVAEFLRALGHSEVSKTLQGIARAELTKRLVELSQIEPIYVRWPHKTGLLFWYWHEEDAESLARHLANRLKAEPGDAPLLLLSRCPLAYGSGPPHRVEFSRDGYEELKALVDPAVVERAIVLEFGEVPADREARFNQKLTENERVVREFMYQHKVIEPQKRSMRDKGETGT